MFEGWDSFYLLIGGAAGALIGLLFVVATLNPAQDRDSSLRGASLYMTPIVYHLAVVLSVSALTMVPHLPHVYAADWVAVATTGGLAQVIHIVHGIRNLPHKAHWSDIWAYGLAPGVLYVGMAATAYGLFYHYAWAAPAMAAVLTALLLSAIRNAWDLVTWLAPKDPPPAI
jgi:hypothetical protein